MKFGLGTLKITLLVVIICGTLVILLKQGRIPSSFPAINPLILEGHHRLLILAPHCDDETLSSAGLILAAERANIAIRVVIETNGDGYLFATMEDFHRLYPHPVDFIRMGKLRQQESISALKLLGVTENQIDFLSYPDRGTPNLWNLNWDHDNPYRSPYSGDKKSPYPLTYDQQAAYSGKDLIDDLQSILQTYRPDLIIYPNPEDVHPDHWGLSVFMRAALAIMEHNDPAFHPESYTYLVHRPDFPAPKKYLPQSRLIPPSGLASLNQTWYQLDLTPNDVALKEKAIREYKSQLPLLGKLLESFVRTNELFSQIQATSLPVLASGDPADPTTWKNQDGSRINPVQRDPVRDTLTRDVLGAEDLVALFASFKQDGNLQVCLQTRKAIDPLFKYRLRVTGLNATDSIHLVDENREKQDDIGTMVIRNRAICTTFTGSKLRAAWVIFIGADVEQTGVGIIDQIAWQEVTPVSAQR